MEPITSPVRVHGILRSETRERFGITDYNTYSGVGLSIKAHSILIRLLSMPSNWQFNVNDLRRRIQVGRHTIEKAIRELVEKGFIIRNRIRDESGRFIGSVRVVKETPDCIGAVVNGEISNPYGDVILSTNRSSTSRLSCAGKSDSLTNTKNPLVKKEVNQYPLTKVDDSVVSSSYSYNTKLADDSSRQVNSEEAISTSISQLTVIKPLVASKSLEKRGVPAACDKTKPVKVQSKGNLTSTDRFDYRVKLAAIGVAIQHVEWVICQIPATEREEVVTSAIAWISEQRWIEQPAAAFVEAVRTRKKSAAVVDQELRQIVDDHKSESKQFAEWFDAMKIRGLVEQSASHPDCYATVLVTEKATEWLAQLDHQREFEELERMTESGRDERLCEMERLELAGEAILPNYVGRLIPWQEARELLSSLV